MRDNRCSDAHQIDIITSHQSAPVTLDIRNLKFTGNFFRVLAMRTRNRNDLGTFTVLEPWNLRGARKASANDADANNFG